MLSGLPISFQTNLGRGMFYGWRIVLLLSLTRFVASGVGMNARSLLVLPLEKDLGVTRAEISLMFTVEALVIAATAPLGGWLMDRYGARRIMVVGILISTGGFFLLSIAQSLWQVIVIIALPLGLAYNWSILNAGAPILNNWFNLKKAKALALLSVFHGAGAALLPLMALGISSFGWRWATAIGGIAFITAALPSMIFTRSTPEEMGLTPDGVEQTTPQSPGQLGAGAEGTDLREAMGRPFFWVLGIGTACMLFASLSVIAHFVAILVSKGSTESTGAALLSVQFVTAVPFVIIGGWATDRFGGAKVLVGVMVGVTAGVAVLLWATDIWSYVIATVLLASGGAVWPVLWAGLGYVYGRAHYNVIRLSIYSILILGMSTGPYFAGLSFDRTGDYSSWLTTLLFVCAAGILTLVVAAWAEGSASKKPQRA
ncbi:MAG: MFS transporter [Chloroflexi bacterium]|nr:MFS transporter [Chloroflexota bacterium]